MKRNNRIQMIREAHERELAKRGQVQSIELEQADETEAPNEPTSEKLLGILKATNGSARGDFLEQVDGDLN